MNAEIYNKVLKIVTESVKHQEVLEPDKILGLSPSEQCDLILSLEDEFDIEISDEEFKINSMTLRHLTNIIHDLLL